VNLALLAADRLAEEDAMQEWRRDRIRVKIARTLVWLGQTEQADQLAAGVVDSELGKLEAVKATLIDEDAFEEEIETLHGLVALGNFDRLRNALETLPQLFNRFYDNSDRRRRAEEKIKTCWMRLPLTVRIEAMMELVGFALDHGDQGKALELLKEAQLTMERARWTPEDEIPLKARLAALGYQAGDREHARNETDAALSMFDARRDQIVDIDRAGALRPIAEAYQMLGESMAALAVYKRAVQEGVANRNSRPRAEDLSSTCRSMALNGVEPDSDLWARMFQVHDSLGQPW
jgi:tetratricopeptide (TPR) repeat protein